MKKIEWQNITLTNHGNTSRYKLRSSPQKGALGNMKYVKYVVIQNRLSNDRSLRDELDLGTRRDRSLEHGDIFKAKSDSDFSKAFDLEQ